MAPSPVRRIVLRTGKTCLKVLRALASAPRLHRAQRVLPASCAAAASLPAAKAGRKVAAAHASLDDVSDLEDLQNRLNEAAERKLCR